MYLTIYIQIKYITYMAKAEELMPIIHKWEGGYANHPNDKGGCTMKGITITTFQSYFGKTKTCDDLKNISDDEWLYIFKDGYWDKCMADKIKNQSIANIIVDWAWMSGVKTAIKKIQRILNITDDGIVGNQTLSAINSCDNAKFFENIYNERIKYYNNIVKNNPSQKVFLNGWMNRLNDFEYV